MVGGDFNGAISGHACGSAELGFCLDSSSAGVENIGVENRLRQRWGGPFWVCSRHSLLVETDVEDSRGLAGSNVRLTSQLKQEL